MPDLNFKVTGIEPARRGIIPLLNFRLEITNQPPSENIHSILLRAQIQIMPAQRDYGDGEKERLSELFGQPSQWGRTLRNRLWTNAVVSVGQFSGGIQSLVTVPCSCDLEIAATKYFYALEGGEAPLLFLFSGTVFYAGPEGALQVQQIPWDRESVYRMPVASWKEIMEEHYPNSAWLRLNRGIFDRLYAFKREHGLATWEEAVERLLGAEETEETPA